ncbi:hypothetical protein FQN54_002580 [Arachnomyces sp. PD_36]|nr:hypothetical protein FQN54_002580 [Arachnomyces sp. PD_36]
MPGSRESTPENHPTHGVHFSDETIAGIIDCLAPQCKISSITPLERGKSFNNRIYFVKIEVPEDLSFQGLNNGCVNELVLKLNGQFFDLSKSRNEVSCLSLLNTFVPEIPSPKVLAWSDTEGSILHRLTPQGTVERKSFEFGDRSAKQHHDWILMTRVPGNALSTLDLKSEELKDIGRQLADIVFTWRDAMPVWTTAGNLHCEVKADSEKPQVADSLDIAGLRVSTSTHMPIFGIDVLEPITNYLQYFRLRLETRLQKLQKLDVFETNKDMAPFIQEFVATGLPQLGICAEETRFLFTHNDLSPRNLLIAGNPPRVTGIIDFEFAGYFPELDDFVNDAVHNEGDWPETLYAAYLDRLEERGMRTPRKDVSKRLWEEATTIFRIEKYMAPWWLENITAGGSGDGQLVEELSRSKKIVQEAIRLLQPTA